MSLEGAASLSSTHPGDSFHIQINKSKVLLIALLIIYIPKGVDRMVTVQSELKSVSCL